MVSTLERLEQLFEIVRGYVLDSGGDGEAYIVCDAHRQLADMFSTYEQSHDKWFNERLEYPDGISFVNDQEAIHFAPQIPSCEVEIIVQLPSWYGELITRETLRIYHG